MSDSLSTSQVESSLGQNQFGSVAVASFNQSAGLAHKNSHRQLESLLGSRETTRTRHCCVGGRHYHHVSASPLGVGNKFTFSGLITPGTPASRCGFTPRHAPLIGGEAFSGFERIDGRLKVELRFGSSSEAGVPVPEAVPIHPNAGRLGRQLPRPHNRDQPTPSQTQSPVFEAETVTGVLQARHSFLRVLEGAPALARERAQRLLLRGHRAGGQPRQRGTGGSQVLTTDIHAAILARRHTLIPNPAGPMPLAQQRTLGLRSRAQPVIETQHRGSRHPNTVTGGSDNSRRRHMQQATANGRPYLPIAELRGISGGSR